MILRPGEAIKSFGKNQVSRYVAYVVCCFSEHDDIKVPIYSDASNMSVALRNQL